MPEYLAPGVYMEEVSYRSKSIEGVSTSTAALVGPARFGPTEGVPELLTSFEDYQRIYGGLDQLRLGGSPAHNYVAQAVRGFFQEGGARLYFTRIYRATNPGADGKARATIPANVPTDKSKAPDSYLKIAARYPGEHGNMRVTLGLEIGQNAFIKQGEGGAAANALRAVDDYEVLLVKTGVTSDAAQKLIDDTNKAQDAFVKAQTQADTDAKAAASLLEVQNEADAKVAQAQQDVNALADYLQLHKDATDPNVVNATALKADADKKLTDAQKTATDAKTNADAAKKTSETSAAAAATAADAAKVAIDKVQLPDGYYWVQRHFDEAKGRSTFQLFTSKLTFTGWNPTLDHLQGLNVKAYPVTVRLQATRFGPKGKAVGEQVWKNLRLHKDHQQALAAVFTETPSSRSTELYVPLVITFDGSSADPTDPTTLINVLLDQPSATGLVKKPGATGSGTANADDQAGQTKQEWVPVTPPAVIEKTVDKDRNVTLKETIIHQPATLRELIDIVGDNVPKINQIDLAVVVQLKGGSDGLRPVSADYAGSADGPRKSGLAALQDVRNISIVAAPGATAGYAADPSVRDEALAINRQLIAHCELMRYRVAVLDAGEGQLPSEVQEFRAQFDSEFAALYYPWVKVQDPFTGTPILLPPSGFVTGIYARSDVQYGVHKAPANEVVRLAAGFEISLNKAQQDVLNPLGINCFRDFRDQGMGLRLWGARTISSDSEWKYLNVRRLFAYLEQSIEQGTQWVVFQPNDQSLWDKVKSTISDFLYSEWRQGKLMGSKPEEAFFVKCDATTMTQDDLDNGRLICQIGVAPVKPAEFVIFQIGQWTANHS